MFMEKPLIMEKLLLEEISKNAKNLLRIMRQLSIGDFVKIIRTQLKMSQRALAKRAKLPQSTVSNIELNKSTPNLSTLSKIFEAFSCTLIIAPILKEPLEAIRKKQAKLIAQQRIQYLVGTMNLEKQRPDNKLIEQLTEQEVERLLQCSGKELWDG
jgi:transcriptional regulator with XRE-family HTH domain